MSSKTKNHSLDWDAPSLRSAASSPATSQPGPWLAPAVLLPTPMIETQGDRSDDRGRSRLDAQGDVKEFDEEMKPLISPQEPIFVTSDDFEREIEQLERSGEALSGLFGPTSLTGRVVRESALFLGAGRALLLQLAHPWIAHAIAEHSSVLVNRIGRFHRTFGLTFAMTFGTRDQLMGAARRLHRRHAAIYGNLPQKIGRFPGGSAYRANEVAALQWVHASLLDTSVIVHDLVLPPLTVEERECLYDESRLSAALFGIPQSLMPEHWSDFVAYREAMISSDVLIISEAARAIATQIIAPQGAGMRSLRWYRDLTAHLLPPSLCEAFGFEYGPNERRRAERIIARLQRVYPMLPQSLRFVGPYHEAVGRLAGRKIPDWATQWLNLMWIGRRQLG
jgi:uncharacterized protein (DUF2236 family)